jgi:hypothetical protein
MVYIRLKYNYTDTCVAYLLSVPIYMTIHATSGAPTQIRNSQVGGIIMASAASLKNMFAPGRNNPPETAKLTMLE